MEQNFHDKAATQDIIALVGELEHSYRHAIRSAYSTSDGGEKVHYSVIATQVRQLRRDLMAKYFKGILNEKDWCLCKSAACLRQITYEIFDGDEELLKRVEDLVDIIWSHATGEDLSGCEACKNDIEEAE